jgi:hypothetical protein
MLFIFMKPEPFCSAVRSRRMEKRFDCPPYAASFTRQRLLCDADVLWLGEEAQRFVTAFAADAALFHAAERNAQVAHQPAIHPDRSGVNFFRDAMRAIQVLRPDARGQTVVGIVSVADHFIFVVERRDRDDRAEDLLAVDAT